MNVILLVIDALRPDHLSCNGYNRKTSPNIDKLAEEGVSFLNAYCTLPRSDASIASMLTGMYPYTHGVRLVWGNKMSSSITTLTQILKTHGYATAFIRSGGIPRDGTESGFDYYDPLSWKVKNKIKRGIYKIRNPNNFMAIAEQRFTNAINWIRRNSKNKFFLMLHTNDLHWPYPIPKPYDHIFDPEYKGSHTFSDLEGGKISRGDLIFGVKKLPKEEIEHAMAHYDGGIKYIDFHIGSLIDTLKNEEVYDKTMIIITSDHGENFGEHNYYFLHGSSLYQPSLKMTLIMKIPGKTENNKKIEIKVQSLDIMPTVLDVLKILLVDKIEGISLLPLIENKIEDIRDYVFVEGVEKHFKQHERIYIDGIKGKWRTMIIDDWKIIYIPHPEKDIFELYNIKEDPNEENNLLDKEKEKAEEMKAKILEFLKGQSMEGDAKEEDLTEKSKRLLIKAGYLEDE